MIDQFDRLLLDTLKLDIDKMAIKNWILSLSTKSVQNIKISLFVIGIKEISVNDRILSV